MAGVGSNRGPAINETQVSSGWLCRTFVVVHYAGFEFRCRAFPMGVHPGNQFFRASAKPLLRDRDLFITDRKRKSLVEGREVRLSLGV